LNGLTDTFDHSALAGELFPTAAITAPAQWTVGLKRHVPGFTGITCCAMKDSPTQHQTGADPTLATT
jgi:hypothetical protein